MKRYRPILIIAVITTIIIYLAPFTHWEQCETCGVQRIERGICRTKVDSWSQDELDEYGTYAQWKELNQADRCEHQFSPVKHKTPKMTLDQLHSDH